MSSPSITPAPPQWPYCAHGAGPTDPVGCRGIHVPNHTACLAHLTDLDRNAYLATLTTGTEIDHRGTLFTAQLLGALLDALQDPTTQCAHFQSARFDEAQFFGVADFEGARFSGHAYFGGAQFASEAWFGEAQFSGDVEFAKARFSGNAVFVTARFSAAAHLREARFSGMAGFTLARLSGHAGFGEAQFSEMAWFNGACFSDDAMFAMAQFSSNVWFSDAQFEGAQTLDPLDSRTATCRRPTTCTCGRTGRTPRSARAGPAPACSC
ncbi:pentapeptide repeat-containing protein [Streptomyces sp. NBC_01483]|uniref:pentapeptide repeat-containing protein n=1 Tax=Streptomyces sp. NBC_01483 TaxID=2903883 RepID=UPI002E36D71F|nr:pentapeptide repeat-containing protein [Streptomyces sp. NBC_01483]